MSLSDEREEPGPHAASHIQARLGGSEDKDHPRQRLARFLEKTEQVAAISYFNAAYERLPAEARADPDVYKKVLSSAICAAWAPDSPGHFSDRAPYVDGAYIDAAVAYAFRAAQIMRSTACARVEQAIGEINERFAESLGFLGRACAKARVDYEEAALFEDIMEPGATEFEKRRLRSNRLACAAYIGMLEGARNSMLDQQRRLASSRDTIRDLVGSSALQMATNGTGGFARRFAAFEVGLRAAGDKVATCEELRKWAADSRKRADSIVRGFFDQPGGPPTSSTK